MNFKIEKINEKYVDKIPSIIKCYSAADDKFARQTLEQFFGDGDSDTGGNMIFVGLLDSKMIGAAGYCRDLYGTSRSYRLEWFHMHPDYRGKATAPNC